MAAGQLLKEIRTKLNLPQRQLALAIKITPQLWCNYEKGKRVPSLKTWLKIIEFAKSKGIDIDFDDMKRAL